ncbi:MAG: PstS family phosphate ABC transporter substrate-binding protein [Cypionkella sp.]
MFTRASSMLMTSAFALVAATGIALAAGEAEPAPPIEVGPIIWPLPAPAEALPQTDAEKAVNQAEGRALPTAEVLQPTLDPALESFVPSEGEKPPVSFRVGASDILPRLVEGWVAAFQQYYPGFELEIDKPMAGSLGTLELIEGNVDFVFVSRELKPSDITSFEEKFGYGPLSVPISGGSYRHYGFLDAMAFMVHKDNPIESLTYQQIDSIFSSTRHHGGEEITTWGQLGLTGEWADKPIHTYGIKPWNGFEEFIRQKVLSTDGNRGEWREDVHFDPVFFPVARRISADDSGLGYTGLSVVNSAVKVVPIQETADSPALAPTYENVAMAQYPLSRVVYLNANKNPDEPLAPALDEFLRFILSKEGQQVVVDMGIFLPLRSQQVSSSLDFLNAGAQQP